jgi:predicted DsbA family dithiol-disulfide isomerase
MPPDTPIEVLFFHDVLCSWCLLAEGRLRSLLSAGGSAASITLERRAFPTRHRDTVPTAREARVLARHYQRAGKTWDGKGIIPDLWKGVDPPLSSLPPLRALLAARAQSHTDRDLEGALLDAMREAAFRRGINIARRDVLIELAERVGLSVDRFVLALDSPLTEEALYAEHDEGEARGINGVPTLLLRCPGAPDGSPEWVLSGCREIYEYREIFEQFRNRVAALDPERLLH